MSIRNLLCESETYTITKHDTNTITRDDIFEEHEKYSMNKIKNGYIIREL